MLTPKTRAAFEIVREKMRREGHFLIGFLACPAEDEGTCEMELLSDLKDIQEAVSAFGVDNKPLVLPGDKDYEA